MQKQSSNYVELFELERKSTCRLRHGHQPSRRETIDLILAADRVRMELASMRPGEGEKEVAEIVDEMCHEKSSDFVYQVVGSIIERVIKSMFESILVSTDRLSGRDFADAIPMLILPTHNSYLDFLLVSYSCYVVGLGIPLTASGIDFLGLGSFLVAILRRSGAFFIRRSFRDQNLYRAVLETYIHLHICHPHFSQFPLMFFVEGARNRSMKFEMNYEPKVGLLRTVVECLWKHDVRDIVIVPVAVNYDRVPELKLYEWEACGTPKPPENTTSLFNALSEILQGKLNYGTVKITFGQPFSASKYISRPIAWGARQTLPLAMKTFDNREKHEINRLARAILDGMQRASFSSGLSAMGLCCLQLLDQFERNSYATIDFLKSSLKDIDQCLDESGSLNVSDLKSKLIEIYGDMIVIRSVPTGDQVEFKLENDNDLLALITASNKSAESMLCMTGYHSVLDHLYETEFATVINTETGKIAAYRCLEASLRSEFMAVPKNSWTPSSTNGSSHLVQAASIFVSRYVQAHLAHARKSNKHDYSLPCDVQRPQRNRVLAALLRSKYVRKTADRVFEQLGNGTVEVGRHLYLQALTIPLSDRDIAVHL